MDYKKYIDELVDSYNKFEMFIGFGRDPDIDRQGITLYRKLLDLMILMVEDEDKFLDEIGNLILIPIVGIVTGVLNSCGYADDMVKNVMDDRSDVFSDKDRLVNIVRDYCPDHPCLEILDVRRVC